MPVLEEKGVCRLSVVPIRARPLESAEMVTQLLFGDHYHVYEESNRGKWLRIKVEFDGYEGWLDRKQHYRISEEYFEQINSADYKVCLDRVTTVLFKKRTIPILLGSVLPIASVELFKLEEQFAFNGESKNLGEAWGFDRLKQVAFKYLHAPYLWGGRTPFGIDCSGFTQMVFKICGYRLERDSPMQANQGRRIDSLNNAQPGDLAFFGTKTKVNHVGIVLENERIIHASGQVRIDELTEEGIINAETGEKSHSLNTIRRIIK